MEKCVFFNVVLICTVFIELAYNTTLNYRPVIGILAQETSYKGNIYGPSYIDSEYFKFVQMGGARAVPIRINQRDEYYEDLFTSINGVLFPGGEVTITDSGYAKAAQKIYKLTLKANEKGDYFPLWGTCLGFELLTALTTGENIMSKCEAEDYSIPLNLEKGYSNSRMLRKMPTSLLKVLETENVTGNFHHCCLTPKTYRKNRKLRKFYKVLSTNNDKNGEKFISTMEAYDYPIYGAQWHPEKNVFNWNVKYPFLDRSVNGVLISQYFSNFFVNEARKSKHTFPTEKDASKHDIENYQVVFKGEPTYNAYYYFDI